MAKAKKKPEELNNNTDLDEDFPSDIDLDEDIDNDGFKEYKSSNNEVPIIDKPTMDQIFDFTRSVTDFEMQLRGYNIDSIKKVWVKVADEVGPDSFIKDTMTLITSIVKPTTFWTFHDDAEVEQILNVTNDRFIKMAYDDQDVEEHCIPGLCAAFDNVIQLFMGLVAKGHGALTLRDIYAGVVTTTEQYAKNNGSSFLTDIKNKLAGVGGKE